MAERRSITADQAAGGDRPSRGLSAHEARGELARLAELPANWDMDGSPVPNAVAIQSAQAILETLYGQFGWAVDRIVASAEGGVAPVFSRPGRYGDIECFNSGEILAGMSAGAGVPEVWAVNLDEQLETLERLRAFIGT
jgi:hypothetical protein